MTNCSECKFLKPENKCEFGKIEQFKRHGVEVIENEDGISIDSVCPFNRDSEWENLTPLTSEEAIIEENGFPWSCFIYEQEGLDVELAVSNVLNFYHPPEYIHITFKHTNKDIDFITGLTKSIDSHNEWYKTNTKYKIVLNHDEELDNFYESYLAFELNYKTDFVGIYNKCNSKDHIYRIDELQITQRLSEKIQLDFLSFPYVRVENDTDDFMLFPRGILEEYKQIEGSQFINKIIETQTPYEIIIDG